MRTFNLRQAPIMQFAEFISSSSIEGKHHEFCEFLDDLDSWHDDFETSKMYSDHFSASELVYMAKLVAISRSTKTLESGSMSSLCTQRDVLAVSVKFLEESLNDCQRQIDQYSQE